LERLNYPRRPAPGLRWRREADTLAKTYRELDAAIQAANWTTDLREE